MEKKIMPLAQRIILRMKYIAYHESNKIMYAKKHSENYRVPHKYWLFIVSLAL